LKVGVKETLGLEVVVGEADGARDETVNVTPLKAIPGFKLPGEPLTKVGAGVALASHAVWACAQF
jgi:hypothetical protein